MATCERGGDSDGERGGDSDGERAAEKGGSAGAQGPRAQSRGPHPRQKRSVEERSAPRPVQSALPTKLFFRIGEVARALGVATHVLRYWETEFRAIRPQKSARGQRVYSRRDVDTLMRIKELLYDRGFTIAGARKHLRDGGIEPREPSDPTALSASRMRAVLLGLRTEIAAMIEQLGQ